MEQELAMIINSYLNEQDSKELIKKMIKTSKEFGDDGLSNKVLMLVWGWVDFLNETK